MNSKFMTPQQAMELVPDNASVAVSGNGGGILEPNFLFEALEERFLTSGHPAGLTLTHSAGIGDKADGGISRFAHEGMTRRVVGGHWGWSPRMQALANENKIEAYNFPQGIVAMQYREVAAHRPGLLTKTGLKTFVDPRVNGAKLNSCTKEDLVELVKMDGEEWLHYKPYKFDIALIRGSYGDAEGNISMEQEPCYLEALQIAQAVHNCGGKVIVQVKYAAQNGSLDPKNVRIPGILVDAVVVCPEQVQTIEGEYNPALTGDLKIPADSLAPMKLDQRKVVARRAAMEMRPGMIMNLGFGMPDGVAKVAAEEGISDWAKMTIEQGIVGGIPASGAIFGVAYNAEAMLDGPSQFDFGEFAKETHQPVLYVTERAVFEMTAQGLVLKEIAPGVDLQKDILDQMDFVPLMPQTPKTMDARIFEDKPMGLKNT